LDKHLRRKHVTTMIIADAERKAALQMLEQLEMILKIVSIYEEQHMHMNKMIDEGKLCCTSWCSCGFCHQAAESTKIVKTEGEACRNLSIEREERERERESAQGIFVASPKEHKNLMSSLLVLPGWWGLSDHSGSWLSYLRCIYTLVLGTLVLSPLTPCWSFRTFTYLP